MKKSLSIILAILMLVTSVTVLPFTASAEMPSSGKCGENVSYKFNSATGKLTISGTGDMYNYGLHESTFDSALCIKTIVISSGVTSIGDFVFSNCSYLTSVSIPDTVKTIGDSSFSCTGLTKIVIPDSVTSIDRRAFEECSQLTSATIGNNVETVSYSCFYGCKSLKSVKLGKKVKELDAYSFYDCKALTGFTIPYGVTDIDENALTGCESIKSITIPSSVKKIDYQAFSYCTSLESIAIPSSVTYIADNIVMGCTKLAKITVNSNNKYYDSRNNCNAIIRKNGAVLLAGCKNTVIPKGVKTIDQTAFYDSGINKYVVIPNTVVTIEQGAFYNSRITGVTIPDSITGIESGTFSHCSALKSVKFGKKLRYIGTYAFYDCSALSSIKFPNSIKTINYNAFGGCKSLTGVSIPNSVTVIGENAFKNCPKLAKITVGSKNKYYDSRNKCNAIIRKNGAVLIAGCKNTVIPKGVKVIGEGAFSGVNFRRITIPNTVKTIERCAFSNSRITNITIPDSVTSIGDEAFYGCKDLYYVKLSNNLKKVKDCVFANCPSLQNVVIPTGVKEFYYTSFSRNNKGTIAGLNGITFWYCGSETQWKSVNIVREILNDEDIFKTETASQSWIDAYTKRTHFNYKDHTHKMKTKYSKYPTFKAEGKKSCTCTKCKMKFKNIPASKLVSPSVKKVTRGKKAFTVTWKKAPTVAGYQIQYARNAKFKKAKKITVKKAGSTKKTVKKLASGKKYYVRVRAYKKIGGKYVYSKWSKAKTVKTK